MIKMIKKLVYFILISTVYLNATNLNLNKNTYVINEPIVVNFKNMTAKNQDWIGIYPSNASNAWTNVIKWHWTQDVPNGMVKFDHLQVGQYEVRAFYNNSFHIEARKAFTVQGTPASLSSNKTTYNPNEPITINFKNMSEKNQDWIGIYPKGSTLAWGNVIKWHWTGDKTNGEVNFSKLPVGQYEARAFYNNSFHLEAKKVFNVRDEIVADTVPPVITLNGDINLTLTQGQVYSELGATALDAVDGNVSVSISGSVDTAKVGTYVVTYTAKDSVNNSSSKTRTVNVKAVVVVDTIAPVITLNGDVNITLTQGQAYVELNATALDNVDGNVSVDINGSVDTTTVGVYTVIYTAIDSANNSANKTRTVTVVEKINKLETLTLTASKTHFIRTKEEPFKPYYPIIAPLKVMGVYADGKSEELTDSVTWDSPNKDMIPYDGNQIKLPKGDFSITASLKGVTSNSVDIQVEDEDAEFLLTKVNNNSKEDYPNRDASVNLALHHKPTEDVTVKLTLEENDGVKFENGKLTKELTFSPSEYRHYVAENIHLKEFDVKVIDHNISKTTPYTITVEPLVSQDPYYDGQEPKNIVVEKSIFTIIEPPLQQRRGAIRGVTIMFQLVSKESGLIHALVDPPEGMKIIGRSDFGMEDTKFGVDVEWKVPMGAEEGQTYNITAKLTDKEGTSTELTFPIKVPVTKLVQTKIENNELIVTDKNSNLFGMKMKGHNGEDISELKLRTVDYGDVWKKEIENKAPEDVVEHIVFILDNMPEKLNVEMPQWLNTIDKVLKIGAFFYKNDNRFIDIFWDGAVDKWDESKGSLSVLYKNETSPSSRIFLIVIEKSQKRGQ
jgi:hypothetical protein